MQETSFIVLRGNSMRLEGGSMFGNAPKALWKKWIASDEKEMIDIASTCLLVRTGNHNLLFETGCGAYLPPDMKQRFVMKDERAPAAAGIGRSGIKRCRYHPCGVVPPSF